MGKRTVRECTHQQLRAREFVPQRGFKLFQIRFHSCLAADRCLLPFDAFDASFAEARMKRETQEVRCNP
jgi:hypothetical protein